jgi:hypothetical protein
MAAGASKIELVEDPNGLLLIHVLGGERLACEAAHNRFLLNHNLRYWSLIVRSNFIEPSLFAQSISPDGHASREMEIAQTPEIRAKLIELLEAEFSRWECASAP